MAVALTFLGYTEQNNPKGLAFKAKFTGNYGANGVGDLLDLTAISDPNFKYDQPIQEPPTIYGVLNDNLGGSYTNILPNAAPSLTNFGLQMYEPGGAEKATNAAYTAPELAGDVTLVFWLPLQ